MSIRSLTCQMINTAWIAACSREHARFTAAVGRVAEAQTTCLFDLLNRNVATRFGKKHGFARIRSVAEFQAQVPITGYDALAESIEAIAGGEPAC